MLKWRTPLEGMSSNCLSVTRNGTKIPYDGISIKRSAPGPDEFVLVAAGQTISSKFDISEGYDMVIAGTYSIAVNTYIEYVVGSVKGMNEPGKPGIPIEISHLYSPTVSFQVFGRKGSIETLGQRARSLEREKKRTVPIRNFRKRSFPRDPVVQGNDAQKAETKQIHRAAYNEIVAAISDVQNRVNRVYTWFGTPHLDYVFESYQLMYRDLIYETITYVFGDPNCQSNWYAFTYKGSTTIYLCYVYEVSPSFWGLDSKVGTIIHELAHSAAYVDDIAYGAYACKQLVNSDPAGAAMNADNYTYFVTSK